MTPNDELIIKLCGEIKKLKTLIKEKGLQNTISTKTN